MGVRMLLLQVPPDATAEDVHTLTADPALFDRPDVCDLDKSWHTLPRSTWAVNPQAKRAMVVLYY